MDAKPAARALESKLRASGTRDRAVNEKRYLKSDLDFLGAPVRAIRRAVKEVLKDGADMDRANLLAFVEELWEKPIHERRMAATFVLQSRVDLLGPRDLDLLERLLRQSKTWALVDGLAANVVGALVDRHGEANEALDRWIEDDDFWIQRAAILALLKPLRRGGGDFERFGRYADRTLEEKEFFIRKAIGWVLRETSKKRPDLVIAWLEPRAHRASGITMREAVRNLPPSAAERLMSVYKRRTPAG